MDDKQKIYNLRARVDEIWEINHRLSMDLISEQSRCAHLQTELTGAIEALHKTREQLIVAELRITDLLAMRGDEMEALDISIGG